MATATKARYSEKESREIATVIKRQIGAGSLMALGASEFYATDGGLRFTARILPFTKAGTRSSRAAKMFVEVKLNGADLYDVRVAQLKGLDVVEHYSATDVVAFGLPALMLALDWDGDEATNPRYW